MRLIDADAFERDLRNILFPALVQKYGEDEALKGLHFSFQDVISNIRCLPAVKLELTFKQKLMLHLANLQLAYSPNWGANGSGDQKLYEFVTELIDEIERWEKK